MGKNIFPYIILIAASIFSSCSNEDEIIEPEVDYEYGITVSIASTGNKNGAEESTTRAIDNTGGFTAMYDAPYVYMHSVEDPSKFVKLPIIKCEECQSMGPGDPGKGFQYTFCTNEDGSYTIKSTDNSSSAISVKMKKYIFHLKKVRLGKELPLTPLLSQGKVC